MVEALQRQERRTLGADKAYDTAGLRRRDAAPGRDPACGAERQASTLGDRRPHHAPPGYAASQCLRKRIEEVFGWIKTVGGLRKTRHRGTERVGWVFTFIAAVYNLVRLRKLLAGAA